MRDDFCEFIFEKSDRDFYSDIIDIFENIGYHIENPLLNNKVILWLNNTGDDTECKNRSEALVLLSNAHQALLTLWNDEKEDITIAAYTDQPEHNYLQIYLDMLSSDESKKIINSFYSEISKSSFKNLLRNVIIDKSDMLSEQAFILKDQFCNKLFESCKNYKLELTCSQIIKDNFRLIDNIKENTVYTFDFDREKKIVTVNEFE